VKDVVSSVTTIVGRFGFFANQRARLERLLGVRGRPTTTAAPAKPAAAASCPATCPASSRRRRLRLRIEAARVGAEIVIELPDAVETRGIRIGSDRGWRRRRLRQRRVLPRRGGTRAGLAGKGEKSDNDSAQK
jgi:hypothetical protein